MKMTHLIQRYSPAIGGCEQWCRQISRYAVKRGHQVKVLTFRLYHEEEFFQDFPDGNDRVVLEKRDNDNGVEVRRYQRTKIHPLLQRILLNEFLDKKLGVYFYGPHSLSLYLDIPRQILKTDVVHLHGMHYPHNFIGYFWAKMLRKKIVMTPHFHPGHPFYERKSHYWLLNQCDGVFTVSDLEKNHLIQGGIDAAKIFTIGNSIDPDEYSSQGIQDYRNRLFEKYGLEGDEKIVVFLGRRVRYKGIVPLIEAVFELRRKNQKIRLFLAGPSMEWFDDYYQRLEPERKEHVVDLGIIPDQEKINLLHLSDVVALPSQYEAFGIVFLEAWACGKPVIGGDQGAMVEVIDGAGVTIPYGNVSALADAIEFLITNPEAARTMASKGKEKLMNQYTMEIAGNRVLKVLEEITSNGRKCLNF